MFWGKLARYIETIQCYNNERFKEEYEFYEDDTTDWADKYFGKKFGIKCYLGYHNVGTDLGMPHYLIIKNQEIVGKKFMLKKDFENYMLNLSLIENGVIEGSLPF